MSCPWLRVKKLGVESVQDFPFPTPPATAALRAAVRNLRRLGSLSSSHFFKTSNEKAVAALNKNGGDERERSVEDDVDEGRLTAIGLAAARSAWGRRRNEVEHASVMVPALF